MATRKVTQLKVGDKVIIDELLTISEIKKISLLSNTTFILFEGYNSWDVFSNTTELEIEINKAI